MTTPVRRRSKVLGTAFVAAALTTSFVAFAPTVGAELLGSPDGGNGDIRVQPIDPDDDNTVQPAPVIFAGENGQAGADVQIVLNNMWAENDRILVAVTDSAGADCDIAYAAAPTATVAGPYRAGALSTGSPDAVEDAPAEEGTAPTFEASLISSDGCAATDVVALTLTNDSIDDETVETHEWVITLSGLSYNVGSDVAAGPIHNAAYGEEADGETWAFAPDTYGGNEYPATTIQWTNGAYVSPVNASIAAPNQLLVGDVSQPLGTLTISESQADAFQSDGDDDVLHLEFDNLTAMDTSSDLVVTIDDKEAATATAAFVDGNSLDVTYNIPDAGDDVVGQIQISGLYGEPVEMGPVDLKIESDWFETEFLTADDDASIISDVDDGGPVLIEQAANVLEAADRIGGANRYVTSAIIAFQAGCTDYAVVASGEDFADALSANYLAGALSDVHGSNVPVILTRAGAVPEITKSALTLSGVDTVYVIGGPSAVSDAALAEIDALLIHDCGATETESETTLTVNRLDGANRYETNEAVLAEADGLFDSGDPRSVVGLHFDDDADAPADAKRTALLATGTNFADALTAGPLAFTNFPLILTTPGLLSEQAAASIDALDIEQVIILGGPAAVSAETEAEVEDLGVDTFRLAGENRFATATEIADFSRTDVGATAATGGDYDAGLGYESPLVLLTQAYNFADALSSGWIAGVAGANMVLTNPAVLHPTTQAWLEANSEGLAAVMALGLTAAVSEAAINAANVAVG